jgi:very-short-patch-repair endonuclease
MTTNFPTGLDELSQKRIRDLLNYVHHLGALNQRPAFKVEDYQQAMISEHHTKGRVGIQHNIIDNEGEPIWLRIERLIRNPPPPPNQLIEAWILVKNDPECPMIVQDKIIKPMGRKEAEDLLGSSSISESDISDNLNDINFKDVILTLNNQPEIKASIESYLNEQWALWSSEEKPRRETIKIYDALFGLQQLIETQGEDQPLELIWGLGVSRWLCEGYAIDHPLLEKPVEIEFDSKDGAILIRPRNVEPALAVNAYFALGNPGVDALTKYAKRYYAELSEDVEFSPFCHESFAQVLKQAAIHLSKNAVYWPDVNPDQENREPPPINETLQVTDSWCIYARPRSITSFIQDIERFQSHFENNAAIELPAPAHRLVSELSDKKPVLLNAGISSEDGEASEELPDETKLFFPKPYNDAQVEIIKRLEVSDGVVVQGPPGTGKTHTIANIICHYLATGRSVLVTSKGEAALTVLQKQIPKELQELTISLLTNEREGLKQLEGAVQLLANLVSQTNIQDLSREAESHDRRAIQLKQEIRNIDAEIQAWGLKQLQPIAKELSGSTAAMTAMELAEQVMASQEDHSWLTDTLGLSEEFNPQFTDADIAEIRAARQLLGKDIVYIGKTPPVVEDLPDSAMMAAIHDDLAASLRLSEDAKFENIPLLAASLENSVERAKALIRPLAIMADLLGRLSETEWLRKLFNAWVGVHGDDEFMQMFQELIHPLPGLIEKRAFYVKTLVEIEDPGPYKNAIDEALANLSGGNSAFGLFGFGHKEEKALLARVKIDGEHPRSADQWEIVRNYMQFQDDVKKYMIKWNHIGEELSLPKLSYEYGSNVKALQATYKDISDARNIAENTWISVKNELCELFPHGINTDDLLFKRSEIDKTIKAIELNTSRITLGTQRLKLDSLINKLKQSDSPIADEMLAFINSGVGNISYTRDQVIKTWQDFSAELNRLKTLVAPMNTVLRIADKIVHSGAEQWAKALVESPVTEVQDPLTPSTWFDTWQWKRRSEYLKTINGRKELAVLVEKRVLLDQDLKRAFSDLVKVKTFIGLHLNMTERVQGALMRFVSAIGKIGKGTGKRAPRHKRDAYRAMQDCYVGVPCWIMPTWRISESLPSEFGAFDLVIIDEASQSDITALPAILRAKKLLIVGDDKQVSPTAGFIAEEKMLQLKHNYLRDQPLSELLLPGVSIYDLANASFPTQRILLNEHFRCVEPIIRFSMQFYNEALIPLRLPKSSERLDPPLIDVYIPGGMRDEHSKVNTQEVDAIVDEIKNIVADPAIAGRSIGVVSLIGAQQAKAIQEKLLFDLGEDNYQAHDIACGDATAFQGKEKDIVFLSMVVGVGQGAVMTKREDEQRFNVALSRARDRMYLYRSIEDQHLKNSNDLKFKVLHHFANPMPVQIQTNNPIELCESYFERDVFSKLTVLGYNVTPQVKVGPFSIDLVIEGDQDRRLAVELDGDKYHPAEKWMEDWSRQRTMERVGWKFWRCWGSSYTLDPDACMNDLITTLKAMQIHPSDSKSRLNVFTEHRVYKTLKESALLNEMDNG